MQKLVYNKSKQSDKNKLTDEQLVNLATEALDEKTDINIINAWILGYRASEEQHVKEVWKLRKVIKGYIHALRTMYGESK